MAHLAERARLLKALEFTERALQTVSEGPLHEQIVDLYLDALRTLHAMLRTNMTAR